MPPLHTPPVVPHRLQVRRTLRHDASHRLCVAETPQGRLVLLKQVPAAAATAGARQRLCREHELLSAVTSRHVPRPLALFDDLPEPALVLEWLGGEPLAALPAGRLPLDTALAIACQAATALHDLHHAGVLHLGISPAGLLWQADDARLAVLDLGAALPAQGEDTALHVSAQPLAEGRLPFLSPEQAGLLARPLDARSDLYALGITLYGLLAGRLPFNAHDALGWAHAHLTAEPAPLAHHKPALPAALVAIVHRLINKAPDARYQTAAGLAHDLGRCRAALDEGRAGQAFELGRADLPHRIGSSPVLHGLHGRGAERQRVHDAWARCAAGAGELVLVTGDDGIGRTALVRALVQALQPTLAQGGAELLLGGFDGAANDGPHAALGAALGRWLDARLAGPEAARQRLADELRHTLGHEAGALLGLLPQLRRLLGSVPPLLALDAIGTERRLQRVLSQVLRRLARPQQPLLWVVDDLHQADAPSVALLQALVADLAAQHLLLVLVSRRPAAAGDDAVAARLAGLREAAGRAGLVVDEIDLQPLPEAAVTTLLRDMLRVPVDDERTLVQGLHHHSAGNPLLLTQMLRHLHATDGLRLDTRRQRWCWDATRLQALTADEPMVALLLQREDRLPPFTRRLLALAACVGREFGLRLLTQVAERLDGLAPALGITPQAVVQAGLQPACEGQFLRRHIDEQQGLVYHFVHERLRQSAGQGLGDLQRLQVHGCIGQVLWDGEPEERLFAALHHLNLGPDARQPGPRCEALAALNLRAAQQSRQMGAGEAALAHVRAGLALAPADATVRRRLLALACILSGERSLYDEHAAHYAALCADPPEPLAMTEVHLRRMLMLRSGPGGWHQEAVCIGHELLLALGTQADIDTRPAHLAALYAEHVAAWQAGVYRGLLADAPVPAPPPADARGVAAAHTACVLATVHNGFDNERRMLATLQALRGLRQHGADALYPLLFEQVALLHIARGNLVQMMLEWPFWQALYQRSHDDRVLCQVWRWYAYFIAPWMAPLDEALQANRRALHHIERWGNRVTAAAVWTQVMIVRLEKADPLDDCLADAERAVAAGERQRMRDLVQLARVQRQYVRVLQGGTHTPWLWAGQGFVPETRFSPDGDDGYTHALTLLYELQLAVLCGDAPRAAAAAQAGQALLGCIAGELPLASWVWHRALAEALQPQPERDVLLQALERLQRWAVAAPATFVAKASLVQGELQRLDGQDAEAMLSYERALAHGRAHACPRERLLAAGRLAHLADRLGQAPRAAAAREQAREAAREWGLRALPGAPGAALPGTIESS
ncbi:ATP-binding protein [Pseudorhodoferax sp.]|uniref:ATP-binding protein n=1 Tax=Pseudorhodoferax sp. TaxID=1993553 RepID=UPI002DD67CA5|nr:AAA family ATPase [Pseudorhodoferax sp.]